MLCMWGGLEMLQPPEAVGRPCEVGGLGWGAGDRFSAQAASLGWELGLSRQVALGSQRAGRDLQGQPREWCAGHSVQLFTCVDRCVVCV